MKKYLLFTFCFFALSSFELNRKIIQSTQINLRQLLEFEKLKNGQIQDILILNNWNFVSSENTEVFRMKKKTITYESLDRKSTIIITQGEMQRKRLVELSTKSTLLYKQIINQLIENNFLITKDEMTGATINSPKVGEFYLLDHSGKVYSKGNLEVYCGINVYAKVTRITFDDKFYYDKTSMYNSYEIGVH